MQRQAWIPPPLSLALAALCSWSFAAAIPLDSPASYATEAVPEPIAFGDINEDGLVDLAIANTAAGVPSIGDSATLLLGSATGAFTAAGSIPVGQRPESILLLDTNGDGHLDIVTANYAGNSVSIVPGSGERFKTLAKM